MKDDDDYWSSNSKEKDNKIITEILSYEDEKGKVYNRFSIKFTYTLYAILAYCADKSNKETRELLKYGSCNDMYTKPLFDNNLVTEEASSLETGVFGEVYKDLKKFCDELKRGDKKSKSEVETLLEKFSDIKGVSKKGELFHYLCTHNGIEMTKYPYKTDFEKLLKLKDSEDNVNHAGNTQKQSNTNQGNA